MSKADKLLAKLLIGRIGGKELRTLLKQLGWTKDAQRGSHEQWRGPNGERMTLATHSKDLKPYQIKEAQAKLLKEKV